MTRRVDLADPNNPEWTPADFARGTGPEGLSNAELAAFPQTKVCSRPRRAESKLAVSLRVSPAVIRHFRDTEPG